MTPSSFTKCIYSLCVNEYTGKINNLSLRHEESFAYCLIYVGFIKIVTNVTFIYATADSLSGCG